MQAHTGSWSADSLAFVGSPSLQPGADEHRLPPPALAGPAVMPRAVSDPTLLIFDSGLGGLTVFREVARARPDARCVYVADDALFPYGALGETPLVERVTALMAELLASHQPDLVVVACNTASTLVLPALRRHFAVPFVGIVPAIKPACATSKSGMVSVLGTLGTVRREYTQALIRQFAGSCRVTLCGSAHLASYAEREMAGERISDAEIAAEIAGCFVEEAGRRTDTVVLACTHYPLLRPHMERLAPWPVAWLDPASAVARRVVDLIGGPAGPPAEAASLIFTSGRAPSPALTRTLGEFGLRRMAEPAL